MLQLKVIIRASLFDFVQTEMNIQWRNVYDMQTSSSFNKKREGKKAAMLYRSAILRVANVMSSVSDCNCIHLISVLFITSCHDM